MLNNSAWEELKRLAFERDNYKCKVCKNTPITDHRIRLTCRYLRPVAEGGKSVLSNVETICERCHAKEELAIEQGGVIKVPREHVWDKPSTKPMDWHKWVYGGYQNPNA